MYNTWCTGTCGTTMKQYLDSLADGDCRPWPAFIAQKEIYDKFCSAASGVYCDPIYRAMKQGNHLIVHIPHHQ